MTWWKTFFTKDYLTQYEKFLTPQRTQFELRAVVKALGIKKGMRVLDVPCGQGRISIGLAKKGCIVMGVDYSKYLLSVAKKRSGRLPIKFIHKDMRKINFNNEFDAAVNWFTSFGYFTVKEDKEFIKKIYRSLKKGGKFLLDVSHDTPRLGQIPPQGWMDCGDFVVLERRYYDDKNRTITNKRIFVFVKSGKRKAYEFIIRVYTPLELKQMLKNAGFKVLKVYGDYELKKFALNSRRIIILAQKQ